MAKCKNAEIPATVISHWLSTNFSINYMGLWERMNNPDFNLTGFREVKMLSTSTLEQQIVKRKNFNFADRT